MSHSCAKLAQCAPHTDTHTPALPARLPQGASYRLEYIKEAVAEADAVTKLTGLMKQRRRWLNGTFFAMLYALGNMGRIWTESTHSLGRKLTLTAEFMYLIVNLGVGTWCALRGWRRRCLWFGLRGKGGGGGAPGVGWGWGWRGRQPGPCIVGQPGWLYLLSRSTHGWLPSCAGKAGARRCY